MKLVVIEYCVQLQNTIFLWNSENCKHPKLFQEWFVLKPPAHKDTKLQVAEVKIISF